MALLKVSGLTKNFGGLCAVSNVNMEINDQELIGLIGPNGAGCGNAYGAGENLPEYPSV